MSTAAQLSLSAPKAELQKTLKLMESFDFPASPYVGIQFTEGKPEFYRSSDNGFVQTKGYRAGEVFANLHQFNQYLNYLPDQVDISVGPTGILQLHSDNSNFPVNLCVHTVLASQSGLIRHAVTDREIDMKSDTFAGIDMSFATIKTLGGQPTIANGKLVIPLNTGTVVWEGLDSLQPTHSWSPMFSFLKLVCGETVEDLYIADNGYWHATLDGVSIFMSGHSGDSFFFSRQTQAGEEVCKLTAGVLLWGLTGAATLCEELWPIVVDPQTGITTQDKYGNPAQWMLDQGLNWQRFRLTGAQAKMIVSVLKQAKDDSVTLSSVLTDTTPLLRLQRGKFIVNIPL